MSAPDICARKHGGNAESIDANKRLHKSGVKRLQRQSVYIAILARTDGVTCKELAEEWGKSSNEISGRFTELHKAGLIYRDGTRRDGCAVWRAI